MSIGNGVGPKFRLNVKLGMESGHSKMRSDPIFVLFVVLLVLITIGGCATQPTVPGGSIDWVERRAQLLGLSEWQARGRIAVKSTESGGQGDIHWQQMSHGSRVRLSGPFGAGAYEIAWDAESVVVLGKAGDVTMAYAGRDSAERFLTDQLGWSFPAMSLRYWILGVPDPNVESSEQFDPDGWLSGIEQDGWSIDYDGFEIRNDVWLPERIVMNNERARVKLIVDDWEL